MALALSALWVGLLYDKVAQEEALALIAPWSVEGMQMLHHTAPTLGFDAAIAGRTTLEVAQDMVGIAYRALVRRAQACPEMGLRNESSYLVPLFSILERGITLSDELLRHYYDHWDKDASRSMTAF